MTSKITLKISIDHRLTGKKVDVKLYSTDDSGEAKHPSLTSFSMHIGDKIVIFATQSGRLSYEEKRMFYQWKTVSGYDLNPHKRMKKNTGACKYCPF